jgi:hypothetical protein
MIPPAASWVIATADVALVGEEQTAPQGVHVLGVGRGRRRMVDSIVGVRPGKSSAGADSRVS